MRFGVFYEHQLPKPWGPDDERQLYHEALAQVVLADELGFDYAWEVEHHFLEEYSHSAAPEVFLAAAASVTRRIRLGHGIRQVIPKYNHPARTAECVATLDIMANGRVDFGIGESATRLELGGFEIPARQKRAMCLEAAEQIANMFVMDPYPGFQGEFFSMPCRNVVPKPVQKPHPPMWIACTNRDTIKLAARLGLGALAFSFVNPEDARTWVAEYYNIIKSDECVPLGHSVNANVAMVTNFSVHADREEAIRRGQAGFDFFNYALAALVTKDNVPGRGHVWQDYERDRGARIEEILAEARSGAYRPTGIGTPEDLRLHLRAFEESGVDQIILLQQAGRNTHAHITESLQLFAGEVMPEFQARRAAREARKQAELAPFIAAALARKQRMPALSDDEIPIVRAAVATPQIGQLRA